MSDEMNESIVNDETEVLQPASDSTSLSETAADGTTTAPATAAEEKTTDVAIEEKPAAPKKKTSSGSSSGGKKSSSGSGKKSTSGKGSTGKKKKKKKKKKKVVLKRSQAEIKNQTRRTLEAFSFMLPWVLGICVFFAFPLISSIRLSFSTITKLSGWEMEFVGISNYTSLFSDSNFTSSFMNSMKDMVIFVPSVVILAMIIAVLLNTKMAFRGIFRSMFFLPVLLGTGYIMQQLLGQNIDAEAVAAGYEMSTEMTRGIQVPPMLEVLLPDQLTGVITAIFEQITQILWRSGVQILIFISGLQSISESVYESARVDGATEWEMFWKITMPSLAPVTVLCIIFTIVDSATDTTNPLISLMNQSTGQNTEMAKAAAMAWLYLAVVLVVIGIVLFATRKINDGTDN